MVDPTLDEDEDVDDDPDDQGDDVVDETVADAADVLDDQDDEDHRDSDVDEAEVDLSDDDLGGGLFDGVEDSDDGDDSDDSTSSSSDGDESDDGGDLEDIADGLDGNSGAMEEAINDGMAQLGVFGLTDEDFEDSALDKEGLKTEFRDTFEAFRVGYFGAQVVDEYVLTPADGDVSPAWGLAGSILIASAMILWMRPDGDEKIDQIRDTVNNIAGGVA